MIFKTKMNIALLQNMFVINRSLLIILFVIVMKLCLVRSHNKYINYNHDNDQDEFIPRVVNGWPAKLGDVPYQIALKSRMSKRLYSTFCGGVLVTPTKLISAAHCFEETGSKCFAKPGQVSKRELSKTYAVAGNLRNKAVFRREDSANGQWRRIKNMFMPISYKFPRQDICVGHVRRPFVVNSYVAPINYTTQHADYKGKCLASGFGKTSEYTKSEVLLMANLELIPSRKCNMIHRKNMAKFVCTDSFGLADVHEGDSGGPLVCSGTGDPKETNMGILVGIVSGHRPGAGTFFTRVSIYEEFLKSTGTTKVRDEDIVWICFIIKLSDMLSLFVLNLEANRLIEE